MLTKAEHLRLAIVRRFPVDRLTYASISIPDGGLLALLISWSNPLLDVDLLTFGELFE